MLEFGLGLARLRRALRRDLRRPGLPREKVLALVVSLLDKTQVRVATPSTRAPIAALGSRRCATGTPDSFARQGGVAVPWQGRSRAPGTPRRPTPRCAHAPLQQLPGQQLFQYVDDEGKRHGIARARSMPTSRTPGRRVHSKDFSTWHATVQAVKLLCAVPAPNGDGDAAMRRCINGGRSAGGAWAAAYPGRRRKCHINPRVLRRWQNGKLRKPTVATVLRLLRHQGRPPC
jgi:DNA topoisomerase IB